MVSFSIAQPLPQAIAQLSGRTPLGSALTSREWERVPAELRDRTMFSSTVENERLLQEMKDRLAQRLALAKPADGAHMDRGLFIEQMRQELATAGYKRGDAPQGSLRDLKSSRRLGLIFDMNVSQAAGYARWKMDMTPEGLANEPCYELIRIKARLEIRDWPLVWAEHGGQFHGEPGPAYPRAKGRMIALKTDPIWRFISRFGTPWPPFDWGSGMGLMGIDREEAQALGLLDADTELVPLAIPFNAGLRCSIHGLNEASRETLRSTFGDAMRIDGDEMLWHRDTNPETDEQRKQDAATSLRERARGHFLQARGHLEGLERESTGAGEVFPGEAGAIVAPLYLAQASAVAVGRKQLFHDTMCQADAEAFMAATGKTFPPEVAMHYEPETGDFLAWRRDLTDLNPAAAINAMADGRGGLLLGFGLDAPAWVLPGPHVAVRIYALPRVADDAPVLGFDAPVSSWQTYAYARAKDIADAWGVATEIIREVKP